MGFRVQGLGFGLFRDQAQGLGLGVFGLGLNLLVGSREEGSIVCRDYTGMMFPCSLPTTRKLTGKGFGLRTST